MLIDPPPRAAWYANVGPLPIAAITLIPPGTVGIDQCPASAPTTVRARTTVRVVPALFTVLDVTATDAESAAPGA
jgi:hypothetical protein